VPRSGTDIIAASMSGTSRNKMRNPLLSAAGPGFPFETYAENALLVPVTPATPAVLRDGEFPKRDGSSWAGLPGGNFRVARLDRLAGAGRDSSRCSAPDLHSAPHPPYPCSNEHLLRARLARYGRYCRDGRVQCHMFPDVRRESP